MADKRDTTQGWADALAGPISDAVIDGQSYTPDYPERQRARYTEEAGWEVAGMRVALTSIPGVTQVGLLDTTFNFQMPPTDQFMRTLSHAHNDFDTISAGQHSRPIGRQLEIITFPTLLMEWAHPGAVWPDRSIQDTISDDDREDIWNLLNVTATLERILDSGTPVQLFAGQPVYWEGGGPTERGGWDVNMPVTLRNLTIEERNGEIDARYLDVEFHEWSSMDVKVLGVKKKGGGGGAAGRGGGTGRKLPASLEIDKNSVAHDLTNANRQINNVTLAKLSTHYYGDTDLWKMIRSNSAILNQHNWTANRPLGELSEQYKSGQPYKIKVPAPVTAWFASS